jgi:hypothetical protein
MAFLVALKAPIKDFFWIDIAYLRLGFFDRRVFTSPCGPYFSLAMLVPNSFGGSLGTAPYSIHRDNGKRHLRSSLVNKGVLDSD